MTIHLVKLCVGCASVEDLELWQRHRLEECVRLGQPAELKHVTRQTPRREGFEPGRSSLYWVFGGYVRARQLITELREVKGEDGIGRCAIVFANELIPTEPLPRRPFQGWRYLGVGEVPADLGLVNASILGDATFAALSAQMRADLRELRLI